MKRRCLEVFVLVCLVTVFLSQGWKPMEPEPRTTIDKTELNIHGVRLGMSLEELKALHGEPTESTETNLRYGDEWPGYLEVTIGMDGKVDGIEGDTLFVGTNVVVQTGDTEESWERVFGSVSPQKEYEPAPPCEWFPPKIAQYKYSYPRLDLYIGAGDVDGMLPSPIRAKRFFLSPKNLRLLPFGIHLPVEPTG